MFTDIGDVNTFLRNRKKLGMKLGLQRVKQLLTYAGNPEQLVPLIHVAGTNGKGSTIHFIDEALRASGYRTGVFSSPTLTDVRGYFTVNGVESDAIGIVQAMNELYESILFLDQAGDAPTEFEIVTALAFLYFAPRTDIVIVETGMGGLLDTTNCITPLLSIITTVAKDHVQFLGNTLKEIATHKAGIIKKNRPVIVGNVTKEVKSVLLTKAEQERAEHYVLGSDYFVTTNAQQTTISIKDEQYTIPSLRMKGDHQRENVAVACMALHMLQQFGMSLNKEACIQSLANTTLLGRFEQIYDEPVIIVDSAHNVQAIRALLATVREELSPQLVHILFAVYRDKAWEEMVQLLKKEYSTITMTTFSDKRALTIEEIHDSNIIKDVEIEPDWQTYMTNIIRKTNGHNVYIVTGSFQFIANVCAWVKKNG